jgi:hypothetical protein
MGTDELCHVPHDTERHVKPTTRRKRTRSRRRLYWKRTKKLCKKVWKRGVEVWDWLGSEEFDDDVVYFWRRILRLKYLVSSLLLLAAMLGIHILSVSRK